MLQPSADTGTDRYADSVIESSCPHFEECSGCTLGSRLAETPVVAAAERYFASERYDGTQSATTTEDTPFPVTIPTPLTHWRTQAKLVAANKSSSSWLPEGCVFGLYRRKSHTVVPIPDCVVHHPAITAALTVLETATREASITACENREGELRYVQLQVERSTNNVCLTLVWNAATLKECQPGLSRLVKALQDTTAEKKNVWHSIWCHCNNGGGNAIFSRHANAWHRLSGPEYIREPIPVAATPAATEGEESVGWLYFSPRTFRQGNLDGFEQLALEVARTVPASSRVCELYAGVGVLGLTTLAWHYQQKSPLQWLRCSDENPANPWAFDHAVHSLPTDMTGRGNSGEHKEKERTLGEIEQMAESGDSAYGGSSGEKPSYMVASAFAALQAGHALGANVLIVDPPRKGLEPEVVDELCKPFQRNQPYVEDPTMLPVSDDKVNWVNDVQTLIYVSCGFDALARDCDRLLSSRGAGWKLVSTQGYILFPGSDHVETLAVLERE